jgi:asparagine synthase (glutamine-hydrolysing)
MCGIAGFNGVGEDADLDVVRRMTDSIIHRGPDDSGYYLRRGTALGHRRLAIIDVAGSLQPMTSGDGRFTLVFNGEILNYRELARASSARRGTSGDTEVLLNLLASEGVGALSKLKGQFAFALYDSHDDSLLLARDRAGILPVFYTVRPDGFYFASEVKAFRPVFSPEIDRASLSSFLFQRAVPAPNTLIDGVSKLSPGEWISVSKGRIQQRGFFWQPQIPSVVNELPADDLVGELDALLQRAVELAMVADVPVGAYLSGGVDSSLIVAMAAKLHGSDRLKTFAAGFVGSDDDERSYARHVSEVLGTDHHEVEMDAADFLGDLSRLSWFRDFPISETSDIAVAALARLASDHVKVVLSGEGSDELFGGYPKYRYATTTNRVGVVPTAVRQPVLRLLRKTVGPRSERLATALRAFEGSTDAARYRGWFSPFSEREVRALLVDSNARPLSAEQLSGDGIQKQTIVDFTSWLPDNLLERGDRMTMASSIELRPPFLDNDVIDFALGLPSSVKLRGGTTKWIVKEVARRWVDDSVVDRKKIGFKLPIDRWFRTDLADSVVDLLTSRDAQIASWFDLGEVRRLISAHQSGRVDHSKQIWPLLSLEVWARQAFAPAGAEPAHRNVVP